MKIRVIFYLALMVIVKADAQETPAASEPDTAQVQQSEQKPVKEEVAESAPEIIESTEEVSEDYSIEFPVDI